MAWVLGQGRLPGGGGWGLGLERQNAAKSWPPWGWDGTLSYCPQPELPVPQESVNRLHAQMQAFVSESQRAAELEEKRRYRFLAEKHLLLSNTFLQFFGRVSRGWVRARGALQGCTCVSPRVSLPCHSSLHRLLSVLYVIIHS